MATKKRTNTKKTRKRSKKVYISPKNIFALCLIVIIISFALLLITNKDSSINLEKDLSLPNIAQRFSEEKQEKLPKKQNNQITQKQETKPSQKQEQTQNKENSQTKNQNPQKEEKKEVTEKTKKSPVPVIEQKKEPVKEAPKVQVKQEQTKYSFPKAQNNAQLIFVFDDAGQNNTHLEKFLSLPFPFTVAVLPKLPLSKQASQKIRNAGKEVILHQPMQALNKNANPGPGAITPQMSMDQIISTLYSNIDEIAPIAGINNHEGSAITSDTEKMETILKITAENSLYFLDSRTTAETKIPYVSNALGFSWFERNIFLDNTKTKTNALNELQKGLALANKNGSVIMIGHIWSADFLPDFLKEVYPILKEQGYTFSFVSNSNARKF